MMADASATGTGEQKGVSSGHAAIDRCTADERADGHGLQKEVKHHEKKKKTSMLARIAARKPQVQQDVEHLNQALDEANAGQDQLREEIAELKKEIAERREYLERQPVRKDVNDKQVIMIAGGTDGIGLSLVKLLCSEHNHRDHYKCVYILGRDFREIEALMAAAHDDVSYLDFDVHQKALFEGQAYAGKDTKSGYDGKHHGYHAHEMRLVKVQCDILDVDTLERLLDAIPNGVDAFVNTIGTFYRAKAISAHMLSHTSHGTAPVTNPDGDYAQAEDTPFRDIQEHFELNTVHNIHFTNLMAKKMKRQSAAGFGQILVCLASLAVHPRENYSLQSATKGGYKLFVDALRCELQPEGVRVMTIHPPSVNTNIFKKAGDRRDVSKYEDPIEVAKAIKFMLDQSPKLAIHELLMENRYEARPG